MATYLTNEELAQIKDYHGSREQHSHKDVAGDVYIEHVGKLLKEVGLLYDWIDDHGDHGRTCACYGATPGNNDNEKCTCGLTEILYAG